MHPAFCAPAPTTSFLRQRQALQTCRTHRPRPRVLRAPACVQRAAQPDTKTDMSHHVHPYDLHEWKFKSFNVRYATAGVTRETAHNPTMILVHGFGANCQHWRRNLAPLADAGFRVYALDLLGFGMGDKPAAGTLDADGNPVSYTFEYWTSELRAFIREIAEPSESPVFLVANSVGAMVTMQLAVEHPHLVAAQVLISPSLRQLNVRKRSWVQGITAPFLMKLLSYRPLGAFFLNSLAQPKQLRNVLQNAYAVADAVDDQLLSILGKPAYTPGALDVFLSFIMYDDGPIPEDFLPVLTQPSLVIWGEDDQFEPYELGQALRHYSTVERFVPLPGVGHCAHDEKPDLVNGLICEFVSRHLHRAELPSG